MKKCDLLLVHYNFDPIGKLIRVYTHSYWNHIALFISDSELIESSRHGIKIVPLSKYKNKKLYKTKLIKTNLTESQQNIIINIVLSLRKKLTYIYRFYVLSLIAMNQFKIVPCITCSGFIAYCFSKIGVIFNKNKLISHITPEDIRTYYEK